MKIPVLSLLALLTLNIYAEEVKKDTYVCLLEKFSIEIPRKKMFWQGGLIAQFYYPFSNGFSANINIMKQQFSGTLDLYEKISRANMKRLKWEITSSKNIADGRIFQYKGVRQKREYRFYCKVVQRDGFIYLITATLPADEWNIIKDEVTAGVESFKFIE